MKKIVIALTMAFLGTQAFAGEVIDGIKKSGNFNVATRPSSIPYAGKPTDSKFGEYAGYSIEICNKIVASFNKKYKATAKVNFVQVDGKTRWLVIDGGNADLECGSTTWLPERADKFATAIIDSDSVIPVTLKINTTINSIEDLKGKRIVVVSGTTGEKAINKLKNEKGWEMNINSVSDYSGALRLVESQVADALITDKDLAVGIFLKSGATNFVVKDSIVLVPHEPIGLIMSKRDPEFVDFVINEVKSQIKDGSLWAEHDKWFNAPTPAFGNANLQLTLTAEQKKAITEQK